MNDPVIRRKRAEKRRERDRTTHPIAAIEKRVIHSAAFADLGPSSVVVMVLLAANLAKDRNGHIQLSEADAAAHGVERKTLRRALADLEVHGFIHKTKHGGKVQGHCHKWALTWMPIKSTDGLCSAYLEGFKMFAYDDWQKKSQGAKCPLDSAQNVPLTPIRNPKMSPTQGTKSTLKTINTNSGDGTRDAGVFLRPPTWQGAPDWRAAELARLGALGLANHRCFQVPPSAHRPPNGRSGARGQGSGL